MHRLNNFVDIFLDLEKASSLEKLKPLYSKNISSQQKSKTGILTLLDIKKRCVKIMLFRAATLTVDLGFICVII
jgi:hypothetical protein